MVSRGRFLVDLVLKNKKEEEKKVGKCHIRILLERFYPRKVSLQK